MTDDITWEEYYAMQPCFEEAPMSTTQEHPIDRLHFCTDFFAATRHYEAGIEFERRQTGSTAPFWQEEIDESHQAYQIVAEATANAQKIAVSRLRAAGLTKWADALESGDYGSLAF